MFPENVGYPLKMVEEGPYYYMMEVHYNNPSYETFVDNSGIRTYYTDVLREFDMGLLHFGLAVTPFQVRSNLTTEKYVLFELIFKKTCSYQFNFR